MSLLVKGVPICFEKVKVGTKKDGIESKEVMHLEYKVTTCIGFLAFAIPKVQDLIMHNFVAKWQDKEFKLCVKNVKEG